MKNVENELKRIENASRLSVRLQDELQGATVLGHGRQGHLAVAAERCGGEPGCRRLSIYIYSTCFK